MNNIKFIIAVIATLISANEVMAQQSKSIYFLESTPMSININPANRPNSGYISIPLLGGLGVNLSSNSLSLDKIMYPTSNGLVSFLDPSVDATSFLNSLADDNQLNVNFDMQILGAGFYSGDGYWNIGIGLNSVTNASLPKELFSFAKTGLESTGQEYDISDISMVTNNYVDISLGYSHQINKKITIGGAVKFLIGGANAEMRMTDLKIRTSEDSWDVRSQGTINTYMKGLTAKNKTGANGEYIDGFDNNGLGIAGYGAAIDLGITYRPISNLKIVGAITDLGFISWNKNSNINGASDGTLQYTGFKIPISDGEESIESQFDAIKDDAAELLQFNQGESKSETKMIASAFNAGGEYSILNDAIGFGLLYSGYISSLNYEQELTISANFRPTHWFSGGLSYSFLHSSFSTFGFALNFHPSWINFMIGTDYMITNVSSDFIPINQKSVNVYFGLSVPIGVKAFRKKNSKANNYHTVTNLNM